MVDVFVSYSRDDRGMAEKIAHALEARGFNVWWDPELLPGESYASKIAGVLAETKAVLVLWSQQSVSRGWVLDEAAFGRDHNKLVPVMIADIDPPIGFRQVQAESLTEWPGPEGEDNFERVVRALEGLRGRPAEPPPKTRQTFMEPSGARPLTRMTGIWMSMLLGLAIGLFWGLADYESPKPSTDNVPAALGTGLLLGLIAVGPLLMLARWLTAMGSRRRGKRPMRYFDVPFTVILAAAGLSGLLFLMADTTDVGLMFAAITGFLFMAPILGLGYFLISQVSEATPAAPAKGLKPSAFERFAPIAVAGAAVAAIALFAVGEATKGGADTPLPPEEEIVTAEAETFGLTPEDLTVLPAAALAKTALERSRLEAIEAGAARGEALAQLLLCLIYDNGADSVGVAQNLVTARRWCEAAAAQGSALANVILSSYRRNGTAGFEADPAAAHALLMEAADAGDARAQYEVGWRNLGDGTEPSPNPELALQYTRRAAEQGYQDAQFNLAWMYENGRAVPQDYATAMIWYQKLAEEGSAIGVRGVGWMKLNGWGAPQDYAGAEEMLRKASGMGDGNATAILAGMYENGNGVTRDLDEAVRLYRLALTQGFRDAETQLTRLGFSANP